MENMQVLINELATHDVPPLPAPVYHLANSRPEVPPAQNRKDGEQLLERYRLQRELVDTLLDTENHSHLAARVAACHCTFHHKRCENNHHWANAQKSCSIRICPHDSRRRSLILAARLERFLAGQEGLRYLVLAERNSEILTEGIASLWEAWTRLRRSACWKGKVRGCIAVLEVTFNSEQKSWHPHLNVLTQGEFFPFAELNQAWIAATAGRGRTSFIREADAGTVRELIKYVTKLSDLLGNAPALDEFLTAVARKRLVRTYGTFYRMPVDDEENPEEECPDCGSHVFVNLGFVPFSLLSVDAAGVIRMRRFLQGMSMPLPRSNLSELLEHGGR